MKVTAWIPTSTPPTMLGWYERKYACEESQKFCDWWNGKEFIMFDTTGVEVGADPYPYFWRGLAEKP